MSYTFSCFYHGLFPGMNEWDSIAQLQADDASTPPLSPAPPSPVARDYAYVNTIPVDIPTPERPASTLKTVVDQLMQRVAEGTLPHDAALGYGHLLIAGSTMSTNDKIRSNDLLNHTISEEALDRHQTMFRTPFAAKEVWEAAIDCSWEENVPQPANVQWDTSSVQAWSDHATPPPHHRTHRLKACWKCKGYGHLKKDCLQPRSQRVRSSTKKPTHYANDPFTTQGLSANTHEANPGSKDLAHQAHLKWLETRVRRTRNSTHAPAEALKYWEGAWSVMMGLSAEYVAEQAES
jgi:hypothetical protein